MRVLYIRHSAVGVALLPIHLYFASFVLCFSTQGAVETNKCSGNKSMCIENNQCVSKQINVYGLETNECVSPSLSTNACASCLCIVKQILVYREIFGLILTRKREKRDRR